MATILAVGIATLDIINSVDAYPAEDDELRATSQRVCRGGNATNTLVVLSQLGHQCHWAGVSVVDEADAAFIENDLAQHQINSDAVTRLKHGKVPTSYITHNRSTGSRTIVHYRDLPEYAFDAFSKIKLSPFDWLHFEGRNVDATAQMLQRAKSKRPALRCSLETEKERVNIDRLFPHADVLLFSKVFAQARGYQNAAELFSTIRPLAPNATLICAWGTQGAWGLDAGENRAQHSPAFIPDNIVDTLAAGDTFNAGIIDALNRKLSLPAALTSACQLAGKKCGHAGLAFLNEES